MGVTSLPDILVMSLSYLSSELFDPFLFFLVLCVGLKVVAVARFQSVRGIRGASHHLIWQAITKHSSNISLPWFMDELLLGWTKWLIGNGAFSKTGNNMFTLFIITNSATAECPFPTAGALRLWRGACIKVEWWYKYLFTWPMYCMKECILVAVHSYGL